MTSAMLLVGRDVYNATLNRAWRFRALLESERAAYAAKRSVEDEKHTHPNTRLRTPGGMPARTASSARAMAVSGVESAGLSTTVQPAAIAGAHCTERRQLRPSSSIRSL